MQTWNPSIHEADDAFQGKYQLWNGTLSQTKQDKTKQKPKVLLCQ